MSWFRSFLAGEAGRPALRFALDVRATSAEWVGALALLIARIADIEQPVIELRVGSDEAAAQPLPLPALAALTTLTPAALLDACERALSQRAQVGWVEVSHADGVHSLRISACADHVAVVSEGVAAALMEALPALLRRALLHLQERPPAPLTSLDLLPPQDVAALLERCRGPARGYRAEPVTELIRQQVRATPSAPAIEVGAVTLSYAELWRRSTAVASALAQHLSAQEPAGTPRVGVLMNRSADWVVAVLGCMRAGGVYVPLNAHNPREHQARILEQAEIRTLICGAAAEGAALARGNLRAVTLAELEAAESLQADAHCVPDLTADAYCIFTSGSTGEPKGIRISHGALSNFVQACPEVFGTSAEHPPRHLQFCEPSFDVHIFELFHPLCLGGAVIIDERRGGTNVHAVVRYIEQKRVDTLSPPTAFWHHWREQIELGRSRIPACVRRVIVGGEMAQTGWFGLKGLPAHVELMNGYGPAETNYASVFACRDEQIQGRYVPVGRLLPNFWLKLVDRHGHVLPAGATGEIVLGGAGVAQGYIAASAREQARFGSWTLPDGTQTPTYSTGDYGYVSALGELVCLGRLDDQLKIRGARVEPGYVEVQLRRCAGVREAVVFAVMTGAELQLATALELSPGADLTPIFAELAERVPDYMVPQQSAVVHGWPLNANGKLDRATLRKLILKPSVQSDCAGALAPARFRDAPLIRELQRIWTGVVQGEAPAPTLDLQALGISSLRLGMFLAEALEHCGVEVPPEELFGLRTLAQLARAIEARRPPKRDAGVSAG